MSMSKVLASKSEKVKEDSQLWVQRCQCFSSASSRASSPVSLRQVAAAAGWLCGHAGGSRPFSPAVPQLFRARAQAEIWSERGSFWLVCHLALRPEDRFLPFDCWVQNEKKEAVTAGWCQLLPLEPRTRRWESDSKCV